MNTFWIYLFRVPLWSLHEWYCKQKFSVLLARDISLNSFRLRRKQNNIGTSFNLAVQVVLLSHCVIKDKLYAISKSKHQCGVAIWYIIHSNVFHNGSIFLTNMQREFVFWILLLIFFTRLCYHASCQILFWHRISNKERVFFIFK